MPKAKNLVVEIEADIEQFEQEVDRVTTKLLHATVLRLVEDVAVLMERVNALEDQK